MSKKEIFSKNIKKFRIKPVSNRFECDGLIISYDEVYAAIGDEEGLYVCCSGDSNIVGSLYRAVRPISFYDDQAVDFLAGYRAYLDHKQRQL